MSTCLCCAEKVPTMRIPSFLHPAPSVKTLCAAFPGLDATRIKTARAIMTGAAEPYEVSPVCRKWCDSCYSLPTWSERAMEALSEVLDGYGAEALWPEGEYLWPRATYVNMGDTYAPTILYDYASQRFAVTSWGDYVETKERRGVHFR